MPDSDESAPSREAGGALGLGERLRSARKARALSLEQVSESLHLDETIVLALEGEQFDSMGAPVFVRGHLKAYAKLVGLDESVVLDAYRAADPGSESVPRIASEPRRSVTINPVMWAIWGFVGLLVLFLGLYVLQDDEPPRQIRRGPALEEPAPSPVVPETVSSTPSPEPAGDVRPEPAESRAAEPLPDPEPIVETAPEVAIEPAPPPEPAVIDTSVAVRLVFNGESWVEISDANRRLLFGLQRPGRERNLSGDPPFDFLLGNFGSVELYVDDALYAIPRGAVRGNVARFAISRADLE